MTEIVWYPFYVGDYARKTAHLSLLEHGAYRLLLDHYYATRQPLPNSPKELYRICRAHTPSERAAVLSTAAKFFIESGTLLRNKKCDSEISKQLKYRDSQSAKAKLRHSHGNATGVLHARVPQPQPDKKERNILSDAKKGSRFALTDLPEEWTRFCHERRPDINPDELFAEFKDYWSAVPGQKGVKLDWSATWRNRVRNAHAKKLIFSAKGNSNAASPKSKWDIEAERIAAKWATQSDGQTSLAESPGDGVQTSETIRSD